MARRQRHLRDLAHIPCRDDVAPGVRIGAQQFQRGADLVDVLTGRGGPRPPLHAIHRSQIPSGRGPFIPDGHAVLVEPADVGVAAQEPQQLVDHRLGVHLLGGDQREAGRQVVAHLMAEQAAGAGAGAVGLRCAPPSTRRSRSSYGVGIGTPISLRPAARVETKPCRPSPMPSPPRTVAAPSRSRFRTATVPGRASSCTRRRRRPRRPPRHGGAAGRPRLCGAGARRVLPQRRLGAVQHEGRVQRQGRAAAAVRHDRQRHPGRDGVRRARVLRLPRRPPGGQRGDVRHHRLPHGRADLADVAGRVPERVAAAMSFHGGGLAADDPAAPICWPTRSGPRCTSAAPPTTRRSPRRRPRPSTRR